MTIAGGNRVKGSRDAILGILRWRTDVSVDTFADELGLAGATVRRHLDVLLRDGYISVTQVRGRIGRPRYAFSLTEAGAELFPHHYVRQTHRLIDEIVNLAEADTVGLDGSDIAYLVFDKMADRLADEYGSRVAGNTVEERVRVVANLLADEGFYFEVDTDSEGVLLLGNGCPCIRFVNGDRGNSCDHDRRMLELLIGSPVITLSRTQQTSEFLRGYRVPTEDTVNLSERVSEL